MRSLLTVLNHDDGGASRSGHDIGLLESKPMGRLGQPIRHFGMAIFGLFTTPLWPTYLPAIALTPFFMNRVAAQEAFRRLPLPAVMGISFVIGAFAGAGVISIIVPWRDSLDLILNWVSGAPFLARSRFH